MCCLPLSALSALLALTQDLATGLNSDGKVVSQKDLKKQLISFCRDPKYG